MRSRVYEDFSTAGPGENDIAGKTLHYCGTTMTLLNYFMLHVKPSFAVQQIPLSYHNLRLNYIHRHFVLNYILNDVRSKRSDCYLTCVAAVPHSPLFRFG